LFLAALASLALVVLANQTTLPPQPYRAQGAEGELNRAQQWLVPTPAADRGGACPAVSPARRGAVSACRDRARLIPECAASHANDSA